MKNTCLFAHFDPDQRVDPCVLHYLKHLKDAGFEIVFVSNSPIDDQSARDLKPLVADWMVRRNEGYDFGCWAAALQKVRGSIEGDLLLANNSVIGPVGSLSQALADLTHEEADVYGMVASTENVYHLQSWFLLFKPQVYRHEAFQFLEVGPPPGATKDEIIKDFELGGTARLQSAGFRTKALYDALPSQKRQFLFYNPTHYLWKELIEVYGVPFLKVELLRDNPGRVACVQDALDLVARKSPELSACLLPFLNRVARDPAVWQYPERFLNMESFYRRNDVLFRKGAPVRRFLNWALLCCTFLMRITRRYHS